MPSSRCATAALVACVVLASPAVARADIFVSPFLGLKFKGATNNLDADRGVGANDTKMAVGISGVFLSDDGIGAELELAHQPRFFERRASNNLVTRSGVTTLGGNLVLAIPLSVTRDSLRPYAVAGLGWMHASADTSIGFFEFSNDFLGLTLGIGAVGFVTDVVGLRFDLRLLKSIASADVTETSGDSSTLRFWRATIGVVFR